MLPLQGLNFPFFLGFFSLAPRLEGAGMIKKRQQEMNKY